MAGLKDFRGRWQGTLSGHQVTFRIKTTPGDATVRFNWDRWEDLQYLGWKESTPPAIYIWRPLDRACISMVLTAAEKLDVYYFEWGGVRQFEVTKV